MPARPLSADTSAVVKLETRLDNEAIDLAKHRTEIPATAAPNAARAAGPGWVDFGRLVDDADIRRP